MISNGKRKLQILVDYVNINLSAYDKPAKAKVRISGHVLHILQTVSAAIVQRRESEPVVETQPQILLKTSAATPKPKC